MIKSFTLWKRGQTSLKYLVYNNIQICGNLRSGRSHHRKKTKRKWSATDTFDDLPAELALKILSFFPQLCLPIIAQVSTWWKTIAFDPCLSKEVFINLSSAKNMQHVRNFQHRATMIRKLDTLTGPLDVEIIALGSIRFKIMKEMAIPGRALSHASMPVILRTANRSVQLCCMEGIHHCQLTFAPWSASSALKSW